ncbi:MAG: outer membrane beta-barrel protein [bacterium]|nr:outer membrane beta-barrel protein [bacterium]
MKLTEYRRAEVLYNGIGRSDMRDISGYGTSYLNGGTAVSCEIAKKICIEAGFGYIGGFKQEYGIGGNMGVLGDDPPPPPPRKNTASVTQYLINYGVAYNRIPTAPISGYVQVGILHSFAKVEEPDTMRSEGSNIGWYFGCGMNIPLSGNLYVDIPIRVRGYKSGVYNVLDNNNERMERGFLAYPPTSVSVGIGVNYVLF